MTQPQSPRLPIRAAAYGFGLAGLLAMAATSCTAGPTGRQVQQGTLQVHSATAWRYIFDDTRSHVHTPYQIMASDGRLITTVRNRGKLGSEEPDRVTLAPGRYEVRATAPDGKVVTRSVQIEPGRATVVSFP